MERLAEIIDFARPRRDNPRLKVGGVYFARFEPANEMDHELGQYLTGIVFLSTVPRDVSTSKVLSHGKTVLDYAPRARRSPAHSVTYHGGTRR
jgi:chromosome partitioning protein